MLYGMAIPMYSRCRSNIRPWSTHGQRFAIISEKRTFCGGWCDRIEHSCSRKAGWVFRPITQLDSLDFIVYASLVFAIGPQIESRRVPGEQ